MGSTARSPRVRARVTPHRGQGESLVPLYTRESVSLSLSLSLNRQGTETGRPGVGISNLHTRTPSVLK